jgi:hypothetical protein
MDCILRFKPHLGTGTTTRARHVPDMCPRGLASGNYKVRAWVRKGGGIKLAILGSAGCVLSFGVIFALVLAYAAFRSPLTMLADVVALQRASDASTTYGRPAIGASLIRRSVEMAE